MLNSGSVKSRTENPLIAAIAVVFAVLFVSMISSLASPAYALTVEPGTYEIDLSALQASSDRISMCDGAFKKPAKLKVTDHGSTLNLTLTSLQSGGLSGYVGVVRCFPKWKGESVPSSEEAVDATVVSVYGNVTDSFNSLDGTDDQMRGVSYPKTVSIPWNLDVEIGFIQVYIPIMNSISPGSGWQFVRLSLDYDSLEAVEDEDDGSQGTSTSKSSRSSSSASSSSKSSSSSSAAASSSVSSASPVSSSSTSSTSSTGSTSSASAGNGQSSSRDSSAQPSSSSDSAESGTRNAPSSGRQRKLDFASLADGDYTVTLSIVKTDKVTPSMADKAFSHDAELHVEKGAYSIDASLTSIAVGDKTSYLGELRYFKSGYKTSQDGSPTGKTAACKVLAYHTSDGKRTTDDYGGDYPAQVRIPLIKEAKSSGYVPLQAFVPIMEAIAAGAGTQAMYLVLDRGSVALKGAGQESEAGDSGSSSGSPSDSGSASDSSGSSHVASSGGGVSSGGSTEPGDSGRKDQGMLGANTLPSSTSDSDVGELEGVSDSNGANDMGGAVASHTQPSTSTPNRTIGSPAASTAPSAPARVASPAKSSTSTAAAMAPKEPPQSSSSSQSISVREIHTATAGVEGGEKEPPLKGAVVPAGVAMAVVVLSGAAFSAFRNRSWIVE